jgi:hypothetical protein
VGMNCADHISAPFSFATPFFFSSDCLNVLTRYVLFRGANLWKTRIITKQNEPTMARQSIRRLAVDASLADKSCTSSASALVTKGQFAGHTKSHSCACAAFRTTITGGREEKGYPALSFP